GNITAYWKGYTEYRAAGLIDRVPRMMGFEAEGAAPIVLGRVIDEPRTIATAIRIGNPASWQAAEAARDESGGAIEAISDDDILAAYRLLARTEGVFAEPASAISLAGALRLGASGRLRPRDLLARRPGADRHPPARFPAGERRGHDVDPRLASGALSHRPLAHRGGEHGGRARSRRRRLPLQLGDARDARGRHGDHARLRGRPSADGGGGRDRARPRPHARPRGARVPSRRQLSP